MLESPGETSEEDIFLESLTGMLTRFTYNDLWSATNNLSIKLGQGGFGSVYRGTLPDGTQLAVKKLEGIGQGTISSQGWYYRKKQSILGGLGNKDQYCSGNSQRASLSP
ncbi:hypothetical protein V6N13_062378 [Hibiscus sabdariffa]